MMSRQLMWQKQLRVHCGLRIRMIPTYQQVANKSHLRVSATGILSPGACHAPAEGGMRGRETSAEPLGNKAYAFSRPYEKTSPSKPLWPPQQAVLPSPILPRLSRPCGTALRLTLGRSSGAATPRRGDSRAGRPLAGGGGGSGGRSRGAGTEMPFEFPIRSPWGTPIKSSLPRPRNHSTCARSGSRVRGAGVTTPCFMGSPSAT